jgi:hypothetical protein
MDKWVTAGEIEAFADAHGGACQGLLPELVQRLLLATAKSIDRINFPNGSSISQSGWDGHLETVAASAFFPTGVSGWEMSIESRPNQKANKDYTARVQNSLGLSPNRTSFVFVTPRVWSGRGKWESEKRAEKHWADVRAIGADGLETWLASAPAVALWFARKIKKVVSDGIRDLEEVWEEWSVATSPAITPGIVISGRTQEQGEVHQWLAKGPGVIKMQGDSPDESFAFLYAAIVALPEADRLKALSRCVVVRDITQMRECARAFQTPLIIVAPGECIEAAPSVMDKGHHVFLSMNSDTVDFSGVVRLPRCRREPLEQALRDAGMSQIDAQRHLRESGRSIPVLRRQLFRSGLGRAPAWAESNFAASLIPVLLVGAWKENNEDDKKILESLSGKSYKDFVKELNKIVLIDDSPIRHIGNVWMLKSPLDAWFLLARHLNSEYLNRFRTAINSVLSSTDPKYELPPEQRWAASVYGKIRLYSQWLRKGVVESLVLLAVFGDRITGENVDAQAFADSVVRGILGDAEKWEIWASLKEETPQLAEASPDSLLEVVEGKVKTNPSMFKELMSDDDTIFGECRHSGLLWGLESIAWMPDYFPRAASALHDLAKIDGGGRWNNRPANSLKDLFLPGLPQTYSGPEDRLAVFDTLAAEDPEMMWKFIEDHIHGGSMSAAYQFRWRDSGGERGGLDAESPDWQNIYRSGIYPRVEKLISATLGTLIAATNSFISLGEDLQKCVLAGLQNIHTDQISKDERAQMLKSLRHTLNWLNSYGEEKQKKYVPELTKELKRFSPTDTLERVDYLFSDSWPRLPEGEERTGTGQQEAIDKARQRAARDLLDDLSIEQILDYGIQLPNIGILAHSLGRAVKDKKEDTAVLNAMISRIATGSHALITYSMGRVETKGEQWVLDQIKSLKKAGNINVDVLASIYRGLPEGIATWSKIGAEGSELELAYWKTASGYSRTGTFEEDAPIAVEKLLDAGRPQMALQIAGGPKVSISSNLSKRLLQDLLSLAVKEKRQLNVDPMFEYYINNLFNQLYETKELPLDEIAKLEWPYVQVFDRYDRGQHAPRGLHDRLLKEPSFFAEIISLLYKDDDGNSSKNENLTDEQAENIASNAREVLESWRRIPGVSEDGTLDELVLNQWIDAVRQKCTEIKHIKGCDLKLAEILSRAPSDPDGNWPHVAVRNLLERLQNKLIEDHIPFAIYNSRGVVSRSLDAGGKQERELSDKYKTMSKAVRAKWPRTAKVLQAIASMYDSDAKREDIDSDLNDLRW